MNRIKSGTVQSVFAVWVAYLLFLIVMHRLQPNDAWATMFARPLLLIIAPLLAAGIPVLAACPAPSVTVNREDGNPPAERRPTNSDTTRRMAMVWLASLVVFASPHGATLISSFDPVFHHPAFLIFAPLLLACLPLLFPVPVRSRRAPLYRFRTTTISPLDRIRFRNQIIVGSFLIILDICGLVTVNDPTSPHHDGSNTPVNLFLGVGVAVLVLGVWFFARQLRNPR